MCVTEAKGTELKIALLRTSCARGACLSHVRATLKLQLMSVMPVSWKLSLGTVPWPAACPGTSNKRAHYTYFLPIIAH